MEKAQTIELEVVREREAMITLAGGVEMEVIHIDGTKEKVKVRQIPATKLEEFMTKLADESVSLQIYCDKPLEWVDTLTHESINAICEKGQEINSPFLEAWCRRRAKWTEMTNVGIIAEMQRKLESLNEVLQSVASRQKSPTSIDSPRKK